MLYHLFDWADKLISDGHRVGGYENFMSVHKHENSIEQTGSPGEFIGDTRNSPRHTCLFVSISHCAVRNWWRHKRCGSASTTLMMVAGQCTMFPVKSLHRQWQILKFPLENLVTAPTRVLPLSSTCRRAFGSDTPCRSVEMQNANRDLNAINTFEIGPQLILSTRSSWAFSGGSTGPNQAHIGPFLTVGHVHTVQNITGVFILSCQLHICGSS